MGFQLLSIMATSIAAYTVLNGNRNVGCTCFLPLIYVCMYIVKLKHTSHLNERVKFDQRSLFETLLISKTPTSYCEVEFLCIFFIQKVFTLGKCLLSNKSNRSFVQIIRRKMGMDFLLRLKIIGTIDEQNLPICTSSSFTKIVTYVE